MCVCVCVLTLLLQIDGSEISFPGSSSLQYMARSVFFFKVVEVWWVVHVDNPLVYYLSSADCDYSNMNHSLMSWPMFTTGAHFLFDVMDCS